jgi:hypothetical protein
MPLERFLELLCQRASKPRQPVSSAVPDEPEVASGLGRVA